MAGKIVTQPAGTTDEVWSHVPGACRDLADPQRDLPRIARDQGLMGQIESAVRSVPTRHDLHLGDARRMNCLTPASVHLVVTSPPYWTLKQYRDTAGQLGHVGDYDAFLAEIDQVWRQCHEALVPGGRLICVVGDVCLSRRKNNGRHMVVPLLASIQEHCREIGFDNLAPIIWHKVSEGESGHKQILEIGSAGRGSNEHLFPHMAKPLVRARLLDPDSLCFTIGNLCRP